MDIVDYINEVDRSNRKQEAAYRVTLSNRDFRICCVFYARPLFYAAACFIYTTSRGITTKYTLLWVITEAGQFLYAKSPPKNRKAFKLFRLMLLQICTWSLQGGGGIRA